MLELPKLWFSKKSLETGIEFEHAISSKNCPGWENTEYSRLNTVAQKRIDYLNKCMSGKWEYKLIGWKV